MAITTFILEHEIKNMAHVTDPELDKLYQEIKQLSNGRMLLQERTAEIRRFFRKPIKKILYTLYHYTGSIEVQVINFAQEHDWSINTDVTASYIYAYFYGYFNGHMHGKGFHSESTNSINQ